jgi:autotransporter translocation and assembly factor TamB
LAGVVLRGLEETVRVEGLEWPARSRIGARQVQVRDGEGVWLEAESVAVTVTWRSLVRREVHLPEVMARSLVWHRAPVSGRTSTRPEGETRTPWRVRVERMVIDGVRGEPVPGRGLAEGAVEGAVVWSIPGGGTIEATRLDGVYLGAAGAVSGRVTLTGRRWRVEGLEGEAAEARFDGAGWWDAGSGDAAATVRVARASLARWSDVAGMPLVGVVSGRVAAVRGGEGGLQAVVDVRGETVAVAGVAADHAALAGEVDWSAGTGWLVRGATAAVVRLDAAGVMVDEARARVDGSLGEATVQWDLAGIARPLSNTTGSAVLFREVAGEEVVWRVEVGSWDAALYGAMMEGESGAVVRGRKGDWAVDAIAATWAGVRVNGSATAGELLGASGRLEAPEIASLPWPDGWTPTGRLEAEWAVGLWDGTPTGVVRAVLHQGRTGRADVDWVMPDTVTVRVVGQPGGLAVMGVGERTGVMRATLEGGIPTWSRNGGVTGSWDVAFRAGGPVAPAAERWLPETQKAGGTWRVLAEVGGEAGTAVWRASGGLDEGSFVDGARGTEARGVVVSVEAASGTPVTVTATGRDAAAGTFTLTGRVERVAGAEETSVFWAGLALQRFSAGMLWRSDLPVSGALVLSGTGGVGQLTGKIQVEPLRIQMPRRLPPAIRNLQVVDLHAPEPSAPLAPRGPWPVAIETDVRLQTASVVIEGRRLRTEWRGGGRLSGDLPEVRFGGSVVLDRGFLNFLGRRFTLTRGEVVVPAGGAGDPVVFVTATTRAGGADITLDVEGPATNPRLLLTSNPPLEQNEIVARLLFGRSGDAVSPWQLAYFAYTLEVLRGGSPLVNKLEVGGGMLGFDQLDLRQSEDESGIEAVAFGKQVNRRVYVAGEIGLQSEPDVFAIETELLPSLILRTETSPGIREGIGLQWRRDY